MLAVSVGNLKESPGRFSLPGKKCMVVAREAVCSEHGLEGFKPLDRVLGQHSRPRFAARTSPPNIDSLETPQWESRETAMNGRGEVVRCCGQKQPPRGGRSTSEISQRNQRS